MRSIVGMSVQEILEQHQVVFSEWRSGNIPFREAADRFGEMIKRAHQLGSRKAEAMVCLALGKSQIERSNLDQAQGHLNRAIDLLQVDGAYELLTEPYIYTGEIAYAQGRLVKAQKHYNDALRLAHENDDLTNTAYINSRLGAIFIELEQYRQAIAALDTALQTALTVREECPDQNQEIFYALAKSFATLARLFFKMERLDEADHICLKALEAAEQAGYMLVTGIVQRIQGQIAAHHASNGHNDPVAFFEMSMQTFKSIKADAEAGQTLLASADYLLAEEHFYESAETYHRAMQVFLRCGLASQAGLASEMERYARDQDKY